MLAMELAVAMVHNNCIMHIHVHMILITGLAFDHNYANRKWPHLMLTAFKCMPLNAIDSQEEKCSEQSRYTFAPQVYIYKPCSFILFTLQFLQNILSCACIYITKVYKDPQHLQCENCYRIG